MALPSTCPHEPAWEWGESSQKGQKGWEECAPRSPWWVSPSGGSSLRGRPRPAGGLQVARWAAHRDPCILCPRASCALPWCSAPWCRWPSGDSTTPPR